MEIVNTLISNKKNEKLNINKMRYIVRYHFLDKFGLVEKRRIETPKLYIFLLALYLRDYIIY